MKQFSPFLVVAAIVIFFLIILSNSIFVTLRPGEKGIIFRKFSNGLDKEHVYSAGFHVIAPWNEMYIYDVKEQKVDETMDVLDKNGLSIHVDISVRFYPVFTEIGELHEKFGQNYVVKLVVPEVRSTVRQVMGRFTAEEIYSTKRSEVEAAIIKESEDVLRLPANNIHMTTLLIRSINLPAQIKTAIENKLKQEQEALAYRYKLDKEKSEAERKEIEANGIANYNRILSASLNDKILTQKGIDATLRLAESPNSKMVIVGGGKNGLPLILNQN